MEGFKESLEARYDLKVVLVWTTGYRKSFLTGTIAERVREQFFQTAFAYDLRILEGRVASDHVVLKVSYRPEQSPAWIVRAFQNESSAVLMKEFPYLTDRIFGGKLWAEGFLAATVGEQTEAALENYLESVQHSPEGMTSPISLGEG